MKKQHWQDWVNVILGLWVVFSPSLIMHVMANPANPTGVTQAAMWNHYIVGSAIILVAIGALYAFAAWEEWINVLLGAWLLVSPWLVGFSGSTALTWNALIAGALVLIFAGWAIGGAQGGKLAH